MADVNDLDLVEEREKHLDHVRILDYLLKLKQKQEDDESALFECKKAREDFSAKLSTAKQDLAKLQETLAKEEQEYKVQDGEWKSKSETLQGFLFKTVAAESDLISSFNDEDLEETAALVEESASLIRKNLSIRRISSAIKVKQSELTYMNYWSATTEGNFQPSWEARVEESKAAFKDGLNKYSQFQGMEDDSDITVADYKAHIEYLEKSFLENHKTAQTQKSKIRTLEATIRSQQDTINAHFSCMLSEGDNPELPEDKDQPIQIRIDNAFQRGRKSIFYLMVPLYNTGRLVRSRKLELKKSDWKEDAIKDKDLLERGIKATCHGMALADASMYQDFCPFKRIDPENYIAFYGLHPDLVWKNSECRELVDILDWRASMQDYSGGEGAAKFYALSGDFLGFLQSKPDYWTAPNVNGYFNSEMGLKMYEGLKAEHDAALIQHRVYLQNKFGKVQADAPKKSEHS